MCFFLVIMLLLHTNSVQLSVNINFYMHWETKFHVTCFIAIFALLLQSGTKSIISTTFACIQVIPIVVVAVQSLSRVQLFATPWTAARQTSLSFTISRSLLKLMSNESVMSSNYLILYHPLLLLPSVFPSIKVPIVSCLNYSASKKQSHMPRTSVPWCHLVIEQQRGSSIQKLWQAWEDEIADQCPDVETLSSGSSVLDCEGNNLVT